MLKNFTLLIGCLCLIHSSTLFAFHATSIQDDVNEHIFSYGEVFYLEDNNFTFDQVAKGPQKDKFQETPVFAPIINILKDFKKISPNELACYQYLEEEKWSHSFECTRCANDKYIAGKGTFDRRCSRCGYTESPTAFTIFHGIN
jgi:ribosomal protein S27AE